MFTSYEKEEIEFSVRNAQNDLPDTCQDDLVNKYQLDKCIEWIEKNSFRRTCLQFPENLLNDSTSIALHLQKAVGKSVYVLADTSYGSCCVDEIAAEHVKADSVIHFGHACLSPVTKLPVLYIFEKKELNLEKLVERFQIFYNDRNVIVFYDDVYHHLFSQLCGAFDGRSNIYVSRLNVDHRNPEHTERVLCNRVFSTKLESDSTAVYVGDDSVALQNLILGLPDFRWYQYTKEEELSEFQINRNKFLMQRSHLVEKIKEAKVIGILIGTLGIKNYLDAVERIKLLVRKRGKKYYMLVVGKPNVAKLANFPEIDVFVCIACLENPLLKDFKDHYKPVVSLLEVEMALGDRSYGVEYTSDFRELLPGGSFYKELDLDSSSITKYSETSQELMERNAGTVVESAGGQYLMNRTWRGLEQNLGETEVCKAVKGRMGIPQRYETELATLNDETQS